MVALCISFEVRHKFVRRLVKEHRGFIMASHLTFRIYFCLHKLHFGSM
jgi:hypothetical protein